MGTGGKPRRPAGFWASATTPLVYVNMPKSGCTTIKNLLYRIDSGAFLDDPLTIHGRPELMVHWKAQPEAIERRLKTDIVFTFVRHPLKRAYSCFDEKIHFTSIYGFGKVRSFIAAGYGAEFVDAPSLELHRENFKALPALLRRSRSTRRTACAATRTGARSRWCSPARDRWRRPDVIGKVERFDAGMDAVLALAGVTRDFETPRMNEGPPPPWRYEEVVDDEIRDLGAPALRRRPPELRLRNLTPMLASVEKRFVLLSNPKTGTTALEAAFERFADIRIGGSPKWKHINYDRMTEIFGDYFERQGCTIYAVARHPVDALASWYRYRSRPSSRCRSTSGTTSTPATSPSRSSSRNGPRSSTPRARLPVSVKWCLTRGDTPAPITFYRYEDVPRAFRGAVAPRRPQGAGEEAQRLAGADARRRPRGGGGAAADAEVHRRSTTASPSCR